MDLTPILGAFSIDLGGPGNQVSFTGSQLSITTARLSTVMANLDHGYNEINFRPAYNVNASSGNEYNWVDTSNANYVLSTSFVVGVS